MAMGWELALMALAAVVVPLLVAWKLLAWQHRKTPPRGQAPPSHNGHEGRGGYGP
jgi:hypothetical protein